MFEDINWYNGMLIKPQHMQFIKLLNYFKITNIISMYDKYFYGIIELVLDTTKTHEGIIKVIKLVALHKDGSFIEYDANNDNEFQLIVDLSIDNKLAQNIDSIFLHLACLKYNSKTNNNNRYFRSAHGPVIDDAQSDHDDFITCLKPKPFIIFEKDVLPKHVNFPIINLKRNKGIWQIIEYNPPYFFLDKTNYFIQEAQNIFNHISTKLISLSSKIIHNKYYQVLDHKFILDIHNYEIIYPSCLELKFLLDMDSIRPYDLFKSLYKLLIGLEFSLCKPNSIEITYDHNNMHKCFTLVLNKINDVVLSVLKQDIIFINFEIDEKSGIASILIPYEYKTIDDFIYCFCVSNKFNNEEIIKAIESLVIYSESKKSEVNSLRIRGINREIIKQFSNIKDLVGLSGLENSVCFRIKINDMYFDHDTRLIIELDENKISNFKFNIVMKQN
ncbi:type VI secretion protein [uncultured bacterium]|nr:type VI secretion protein [uncultured bacterium]